VKFYIQLDVLGMGCRDNDARRFARVTKHYYCRRYGEQESRVLSQENRAMPQLFFLA